MSGITWKAKTKCTLWTHDCKYRLAAVQKITVMLNDDPAIHDDVVNRFG